jgi:hypothetical protein
MAAENRHCIYPRADGPDLNGARNALCADLFMSLPRAKQIVDAVESLPDNGNRFAYLIRANFNHVFASQWLRDWGWLPPVDTRGSR